MRSRRFTPISDKGFTLVELMVAMALGMVVVSMALATSVAQKRVFTQDTVRTRINADLRSIMAIMNVNVRQAGENLPATFPAIEIVNGGGVAPDELVLRRNLLDEVLKLCSPITSGTGTSTLYFALTTALAGCDFTSNTANYNAWQSYRTSNGGSVKAYIYDSVTDNGEFFDYNDEDTNTTTDYYIQTSGHTWAHSYTSTAGAIYIMEEWRFQLDSGLLQLIENQDDTLPKNVADGISDFQVRARFQDGTVQDTLGPTDNWTQLEAVEISISATDNYAGNDISRTLTSRFFPRNVLSN